jgi:hypothetical protein
MTVYSKLTKALIKLLDVDMKKSGKNKFAGYAYFELGDFIPHVHRIFDEVGLCGVFSFEGPNATLTIHDTEGTGSIAFASPVVSALSPKGQPIQDLGSTHSYLRRYLWLMAMEIVENDAVDAGDPDVKPEVKKPEAKKVEKKEEFKQDLPLLVDMMIEWGNTATGLAELTKLWKANQADVDQIKEHHKELYTKLSEHFGMLRKNFEVTNG